MHMAGTIHVSDRCECSDALIGEGVKNLCAGKCDEVLLSVASAGDQNFAIRQQRHRVTSTPLVHIARGSEETFSRVLDFGGVAPPGSPAPPRRDHPPHPYQGSAPV